MLGVGDRGGSSKVRNITCARDNDYFGRQHTKKMQLVRLSHARETCACDAFEVRCSVYTFRRLQGKSPLPASEKPCFFFF